MDDSKAWRNQACTMPKVRCTLHTFGVGLPRTLRSHIQDGPIGIDGICGKLRVAAGDLVDTYNRLIGL